jgi:hypothetical protein
MYTKLVDSITTKAFQKIKDENPEIWLKHTGWRNMKWVDNKGFDDEYDEQKLWYMMDEILKEATTLREKTTAEATALKEEATELAMHAQGSSVSSRFDSSAETEAVNTKHFYWLVQNLEHCLVLSYGDIFEEKEISDSGYILIDSHDDDVAINIMCHKKYGNASNIEDVLKGVIIKNYINDFSVVNLRVSSFAELFECVDFVSSLDIHSNIFIGYSLSNPDISTRPPSGVYIENLRVGSHVVGKKYRSDHELGKKNNIPLFRLTSTDEDDPYAPDIKICILPYDNEYK